MAEEKDEKKLKELVLLILQTQKPFKHAVANEAEVANVDLDAVANEIVELFGDVIGTDVKKAQEVVELYKSYIHDKDPKTVVLRELEKGAVYLSSAFKGQLKSDKKDKKGIKVKTAIKGKDVKKDEEYIPPKKHKSVDWWNRPPKTGEDKPSKGGIVEEATEGKESKPSKGGIVSESIRKQEDDDEYERGLEAEDEGREPIRFADPGGRSALRAASKHNPRNLPCPTCKKPNRLTREDAAHHYQCDSCADRAESGAD
jgi:hypothetical protein